jgi:hypothetical protein
MGDLSNLLGDVYGDDADGKPVAPEPPVQHRDEPRPPAPEATSGARPAPEATSGARPAPEATSGARPAPEASRAPAWADESVLDAAFANWTPGPPLDAPAAERDVFASPADPASAAPLPDDLAAALSAALVGAPPADVPFIASSTPSNPATDVDPTPAAPTADPVGAPLDGGASWADLAATRRANMDHDDPFAESMPLLGRLPWQRGDDDILPRRSSSSRRGRGGLSLRRK